MTIDNVKLRIIEVIFNYEVSKGHLKWSISSVARSAKVSRSLIYYHLGKTKKTILLNSLELLCKDFYGLNQDNILYEKKSLYQSLMESRFLYQRISSYGVFCQKWSNKESPYRDIFLNTYKLYDQKLKINFPRSTEEQRKSIRAIFYGLVASPDFDSKHIKTALSILNFNELTKEKI